MIKPRKRFGQHFLIDTSIIQNIIEVINPKPLDHIIEIGPGLGAITKPLIKIMPHIEVIEIDRDLGQLIKEKYPNELTVHLVDALKFDFKTLYRGDPQHKLRIIGNLPYNISTPLLFHLIGFKDIIQDMHFMLQKEVVDRITAKPGTKDYGRLSVMMQYQCNPIPLFTISPSAFKPAPKVNSAMIRLIPYRENRSEKNKDLDISTLQEITTAAFNQRRKTLQNSLKPYLTEADFETLKLSPKARPETLSVQDFVMISLLVQEKSKK